MSVFCPNVKSEAWLKHTELVGNDLNYLSWIGNKGFAIQYTSKGKVSSLYSDLVKEYKDEKLAAKIKALTFSKSIIEKLGNVKKDSKGEYKIEDVKKLLTLSKQEDTQKSDSEILESIVDKYKITPKVVFKDGKVVVDDIEYSQSGIISNAVDYQLRVVNALLTLSAPKITKRSEKYGELAEPEVLTIRLNTKERPNLENNIRRLLSNKKVTKEQIDFVFDYMKSNNIQEISTEQLALELASKYGFSVEINTAKFRTKSEVDFEAIEWDELGFPIRYKNRITGEIKDEVEENSFLPTQHYSNLSARDFDNKSKYRNNPDWEYQELEFKTPLITPSIKGHAQFATEQGIGWARVWYNKKTGVVEIQEIQSDLFQKGRDKNKLAGIGEDESFLKPIKGTEDEMGIPDFEKDIDLINQNQFLQLLNKDNNWVTFFIKSIIQDTAKQTITEVQESDVEAKVRELEREGLLEIDCKGKLKAEDGIATLFEKGGKWEVVTDFKNAPTHKSGGKDISIQGKKVEVEKNELRIENDFGDVAVIPSKYRIEVKDAIKSNCHSCIDGIVESLPKMKDYAGDGTVFPFFGRYKRFKNSLPDNLKNAPEDEYAMRYYWKHSNKPKSFYEAINREQPMFTMEDDGYYHAPSVESNTLRFLKPKNHPTLQYELDWYNSDNPDAVDFRSKYDLDTSGKFYRYVPKKPGQ